jgi:hypothetical protein
MLRSMLRRATAKCLWRCRSRLGITADSVAIDDDSAVDGVDELMPSLPDRLADVIREQRRLAAEFITRPYVDVEALTECVLCSLPRLVCVCVPCCVNVAGVSRPVVDTAGSWVISCCARPLVT